MRGTGQDAGRSRGGDAGGWRLASRPGDHRGASSRPVRALSHVRRFPARAQG